jgi:hypothetical protein
VQQETLPLAANYPDSNYELTQRTGRGFRIQMSDPNCRRQYSIAVRDSGNSGDDTFDYYLENLLPRADSNRYLAVLQTEAGIYYGLKHYTALAPEGDISHGNRHITMPNGHTLVSTVPAGALQTDDSPLQDFKTAHALFADSAVASEVLGKDLRDKISRFYSKKAIEKREGLIRPEPMAVPVNLLDRTPGRGQPSSPQARLR